MGTDLLIAAWVRRFWSGHSAAGLMVRIVASEWPAEVVGVELIESRLPLMLFVILGGLTVFASSDLDDLAEAFEFDASIRGGEAPVDGGLLDVSHASRP